ncbi:DUF3313 domain-containing protein [Rhizobium leguminosarum]|uniref:DUF3313 domain-containing protein n=1 Tax=Rhizobium leguminosarum TaxID=384 RepID=UPI003F99254C
MSANSFSFPRAALIALTAISAGCASTDPVAYQGIASSKQLSLNTQNKDGKVPLLYSGAGVNFKAYSAIIVEPVDIYRGRDHQFGNTSDKDKVALASDMKDTFENRLRSKYTLSSIPGPATIRLRLTLTGAKTNVPVLSTAAKLSPVGLAVNGLQATRGKEGTLSGSVNYSVELYDSVTNRLLLAYVAKQYPGALNVGASLGPLGASKDGIRQGADDFVRRLQPTESSSLH